jgi:hypothetical protein
VLIWAFNSHTDGRTTNAAATGHRTSGNTAAAVPSSAWSPFRSSAFTVLWTATAVLGNCFNLLVGGVIRS